MSNRLQVTEFLMEANAASETLRSALTSAAVRAQSFAHIIDTDASNDLLAGINRLRDRAYDDNFDVALERLILLSVEAVQDDSR